jgi:hypothetical protein
MNRRMTDNDANQSGNDAVTVAEIRKGHRLFREFLPTLSRIAALQRRPAFCAAPTLFRSSPRPNMVLCDFGPMGPARRFRRQDATE